MVILATGSGASAVSSTVLQSGTAGASGERDRSPRRADPPIITTDGDTNVHRFQVL